MTDSRSSKFMSVYLRTDLYRTIFPVMTTMKRSFFLESGQDEEIREAVRFCWNHVQKQLFNHILFDVDGKIICSDTIEKDVRDAATKLKKIEYMIREYHDLVNKRAAKDMRNAMVSTSKGLEPTKYSFKDYSSRHLDIVCPFTKFMKETFVTGISDYPHMNTHAMDGRVINEKIQKLLFGNVYINANGEMIDNGLPHYHMNKLEDVVSELQYNMEEINVAFHVLVGGVRVKFIADDVFSK